MNSTLVSLKSHIIDIFLEELARVGGEELLPEQMTIFLRQFCMMMAKTDNPVLLSDITKNIFEYIIYQNDDAEEQNDDTEEMDDKKDKGKLECEEKLPILQVNYDEVANLLFNFAKKKSVKKVNRAVMYKLVKKFRDLAQGVSAFKFDGILSSGSDLDEDDVSIAINRLQKEQEKDKEDTNKWKTIRKRTLQERCKKAKIITKNKKAKIDDNFDKNSSDGAINVSEENFEKYKWETSDKKKSKKSDSKKKLKNNIDGQKFKVARKNKKLKTKSLINKSKHFKKKQKMKVKK
ncbi:ribosomal RNA processing protein 1 homolog A-like [Centruroides sculpturatus]|uniref:ribosomal RNA processing protein 1 homolog A-like n=1 Tax=Centruroides sculpturatus TaxID=218467 RepID=UPI000C6CA434|nr:ribosomal RNA processing protein 1 homolog A-like [Centruroides sculpturatus]